MINYNGSSQNIMRVEEKRIAELIPFRGQRPFKAYNEDAMNLMVDDIKENGVLHPIVVRKVVGSLLPQNEILSGHNRVEAAKRAGLDWIMCNVLDVNDKQATLIYVNANLRSRKISASERAFAYKLRSDVSSADNMQNLAAEMDEGLLGSSLNDLTVSENESRQTVYYYLRLTKLLRGLLEFADNGAISLLAGVNVSFLPIPEQEMLLEVLSGMTNPRVSLEMSKMLRKASEDSELTADRVKDILCVEKVKMPSQDCKRIKSTSTIPSIGKDISKYINRVLRNQILSESQAEELFKSLKRVTDKFFNALPADRNIHE